MLAPDSIEDISLKTPDGFSLFKALGIFLQEKNIYGGKTLGVSVWVSCPHGSQSSGGIWCHSVVAGAGVLFKSSIKSLLSRLPEMPHTLIAQRKV